MLKNFTTKELSCRCGCGGIITDEDFLFNLQALRDLFGRAMPINSGYRCPEHNLWTSKSGKAGPHTIAAVDVEIYGEPAFALLGLASTFGFTGIGIKQNGSHAGRFIHLDRLSQTLWRPRPWVWSY